MNRTKLSSLIVAGATAVSLGALGIGSAAAQYPPAPPSPSPTTSPSPEASPRQTEAPPRELETVEPRPDPSPTGDSEVTTTQPGGTKTIDTHNSTVQWDDVQIINRGNRTRTPVGNGDRVPAQFRTTDSGDVELVVPEGLAPGEYEVELRGTDADGNPVSETHTLAVGDMRNAASNSEQSGFVVTRLHAVIATVLLAAAGGLVWRRKVD